MGLFSILHGIFWETGALTASIGLVRRRILGCESLAKVEEEIDLAHVCDLRGQSLCRVCKAGQYLPQMH